MGQICCSCDYIIAPWMLVLALPGPGPCPHLVGVAALACPTLGL